MSLDLGELVATISADDRPLDLALEHGMSALRSFASDGERVATTAGQRIADAAADPLKNGGTAAGSAFAIDAVDALERADAGMGAAGADAANEYGSQFADAMKTSQFTDTMKTVAKTAGAGAGLALTAGIVDNMNVETGVNKLAAQLDLTTGEAEVAGKAAGDIYRDNFGGSLGEVNDAIRNVVRNMDIDINSVDLKPAAEKVLSLADTFDTDLGGTTAAVGQLMRTGLAKDAEHALDIIARGLQSSGDKSGDFLEVMNEYSTRFREAGISGELATTLISQGLVAGARDADQVADAVKEMGIRIQDGTSGEAIAQMGLNFQDVQDRFAKGGPEAAKAVDQVMDALRGVKDPADRAALAMQLAGGPAEDMGQAFLKLDPSKATKDLGDFAGAADQVVKTTGSGNQATIETYRRKILGMGQDAIESVGPLAAVAGAVAAFGPAVLGVLGPIATLVAARATQTAASAAGATAETAAATATKVGWLTSAATALSSAASMALAWLIAIGPALLVIAVIAGIVILVIKYWDEIKAATGAAWDWVTGKISAAVSWVVGFVKGNWPLLLGIITGPIGLAVALVAKYWDEIKGAAGSAWNGIKSTVSNGAQGIVDAVLAIPGKLRDLGKFFKDAGSGLIDKLLDGLGASAEFVGDFAQDLWGAVKSVVNKGIDKINALLEFKIKIPGAPDISVNAPNIGHLAKGTSNWRGGPTWVGENGPEILNLPQGSQVIPNHKTGTYVTDPDSDARIVIHQTVESAPGMDESQLADSSASAIMFGLTHR